MKDAQKDIMAISQGIEAAMSLTERLQCHEEANAGSQCLDYSRFAPRKPVQSESEIIELLRIANQLKEAGERLFNAADNLHSVHYPAKMEMD
jgi:hypothetical protein